MTIEPRLKALGCFVYVLGVGLAVLAAFNGSIGPEPPRTPLGRFLAFVYQPYFEVFCLPFGPVGFLIAIGLSGIPVVALTLLGLGCVSRRRQFAAGVGDETGLEFLSLCVLSG